MRSLVYLGLGSNLGDRAGNLAAAIARLGAFGEVAAVSSHFETAPMYLTDQPEFLNMAAAFKTDVKPAPLLAALKGIERALGRDPGGPRNGPREIDLDILLYDDLVLTAPELTIPHPGIAERAFVLLPLAEIAADVRHPVLDLTIAELRARITCTPR